MAGIADEESLEAGSSRKQATPALGRQALSDSAKLQHAKGISSSMFREQTLRWLLGKEMYYQLSSFELSLVFVIFIVLVACMIFTAVYTCLDPEGCASESARRLVAEAEIDRLRARIKELQGNVAEASALPAAQAEAGRISSIAARLRGTASNVIKR
mmetsp:Transcript_56274/g.131854  ORF Transcript_56274/g.131854 Transcript_56274/m.131854 type:complete len:157 (+) Transcript_56274:197-667(+)